MDETGIGVIAVVLTLLTGVVFVGAAAGGLLYINDAAVGAVITDKSCAAVPFGATSTLEVTTKFPIPGLTTVISDFDNQQCAIITAGENGNFAEYHIRSERTILYDEEGGACIWDSARGFGC